EMMPSDAEILACLRPLYRNDVAAAMGAEDDLRTARLLLSRYGSGQPAAPVAQEPTESVLIDGAAYTIPAPVAAELLRLYIELQQGASVAQEPVAWMTPGNGRAITELELSRIPNDRWRQDRCREIYPVPLYAAPVAAEAQPSATPEEWPFVNQPLTTNATAAHSHRASTDP